MAFVNMVKYKGYATLEVLEQAKHYNLWIASNVVPFLKGSVLEVGSGTGNISQHLLSHSHVTLSEKDTALVKHLKKKFPGIPVMSLDITKPLPPSQKQNHNTIVAINVLEHIQDDEKALLHMYRILKKNGKLLLLVPAHKFAFTQLDTQLGHFRRYGKKELQQKIEKAGFVVESMSSFNIVGLLSWIIRAKVEKNHYQLRSYQIMLFDSIVPLLRRIESVLKVPIGISYIISARKK